ncbi:MAG: 1-(5-phosphoribosyl)-5-[(5-phosphoribosylamino)methylideneamino]imidazole-4-carboxamide isomerase, partial [Clostridiales bacterium]|nr:1-(5-phosphoribosyl)-5-[(5-phosphoribosylamino)methylideneamino]imidazole-4-carboxamide isomerase [Clostridiales bacterium]
MKILPAIDLKDGICVRLLKGDFATAHKVAEDAVETARMFLDCGAELIHMVDLDGAKSGGGKNLSVVERVIKETGASVELGGGMRSMKDINRAIETGVKRVIIGSAAVKTPTIVDEAVKKYGEFIAVGIDALGDTVRTEGWLEDSRLDFIEFSKRMESAGVRTIIYTDISRDGLQAGPAFENLARLRKAISCEIVASGGVTTLEDVKKLRDMGIDAAIVGKA